LARPCWLKKASPLSDYSDTIAALYNAFFMNTAAVIQLGKREIRSMIEKGGMGELDLAQDAST